MTLRLFAAAGAQADEAGQCRANSGTFLTGPVIDDPHFVPGRMRDGVELSHTHLTVRADQDGRDYDVAIDNVFAAGYDAAQESVPAPLAAIRIGDRLELCGRLYTRGRLGIDWVHTNCGEAPAASHPDGWVKVLGAGSEPGPNLEDATGYCGLWH